MRIAIIGYGKMGKAVEQTASARGHEVVCRIDLGSEMQWETLALFEPEVAIEFTTPESAPENLTRILKAGIPVVCGTTGWYQHLELIQEISERNKGSLVFGSNFSPGVNLLFSLNAQLASWMKAFPDYDCYIEERHHRMKQDAPGGTGLSLAKQIIENNPAKKSWVSGELTNRSLKEGEFSIAYTRAGALPGDHEVTWTSAIDELSIRHRAFGREGFAMGAVMAAEWLKTHQGFHNFSDIFSELI